MNWWGSKNNEEEYGNKLQFLNQNKDKFDWDNDELNNNDELVEKGPMTHLSLLTELPMVLEMMMHQYKKLDTLMILFLQHKLQPMLISTKLQKCCMRLQECQMDLICQ